MEPNKLVNELLRFHYNFDKFQEDCKMDEIGLRQYFEVLIIKNRLTTYERGNQLLGYVETWRINFEQFGRILCGCRFAIAPEDINNGNICYVANTTIDPEERFTEVYKHLRRKLFTDNHDAEFFGGIARRKKHQPVKVFKRTEFIKNYIMEA